VIAEIAGSNPTEGMDFYIVCLLCAVKIAACATSGLLDQKDPAGCVCVCVCNCV
jgi:hypothetical protein